MIEILLFAFVWLIGTTICINFMIHFFRFWRKFDRELKEKYPEVLEQRKKYFIWPLSAPFVTFIIPNEKDMLDKETFALQRKAWFSFIGMILTLVSLLIFSALFHLISAR